MKNILRALTVVSLNLLLVAAATGQERPRNVILMIGDGMGHGHLQMSYERNGQSLVMFTLPVTGMSLTASASDRVTDSGASGSAMATGSKTYNGAISVDTNGMDLTTILELAEGKGMVTGIIATSSVTHATPAAFMAHNVTRNDHEGIASDIAASGVDYLEGGGYKYFSSRSDGRPLADSLSKHAYALCTPGEDLLEGNPDLPFYQFHADEHLPKAAGRGDMLPRATERACHTLAKAGQGFFLMVEGSQIDWEAHKNNDTGVVAEVLDFDAAVARALEFARQDGHTLLIVTADHETGGLTLVEGLISGEMKPKFSTMKHSAVMVPVFAYGPGAEQFTGVYQNTEIFWKMARALGVVEGE